MSSGKWFPTIADYLKKCMALTLGYLHQGEAHIGESDHRQLMKLCERVCDRLQPRSFYLCGHTGLVWSTAFPFI